MSESHYSHVDVTRLPWVVRHIPQKRILDLIFSCLALVLLAPLLLCIALLIRCSSPGAAIYVQERIGRGGKIFRCYKFRTMYVDADERLQALLAADGARRQEWESSHKLKDDPRITPVGAFLRKTSLDELPQFWNVLKGDLSVVGPRPVVSTEMARHFGPKAVKIFSIRPGLTGLWQVSGRNDLSYAARIELDEQYVDSLSLSLDFRIIAKTIPTMLFFRGAY